MKASSLAGAAFLMILTGSAAWSQTATSDVLAQARIYSFQIREGRFDLAPKALSMMEEAAKADPENPLVLTALANAYFQVGASMMQPGMNQMAAFGVMQKGAAASEKAATIDPRNPQALSGRGAMKAIQGSIMGNSALVTQGLADLDQAVDVAPSQTGPRLQRAFFGVNMPVPSRNDAAVETDMKWLLARSTAKEADVLHLLLGDLYAETGKADLAKAQYQASDRAGSTKAEDAKSRIAALSAGKVDPSQISSLRSQLASNCMMCHAP